MSKTERALHEPGLDDAPDDAAFVDSPAVDDGPLDGMLDGDMAEALDVDRASNGDLPAPTMGFAPPIPDESASGSTSNGHATGSVDDGSVDAELVDAELVDAELLDDGPGDDVSVDGEPADTDLVDDGSVDAELVDAELVDDGPGDDGSVDDEPVDDEPADTDLVDAAQVDGESPDAAAVDHGIDAEQLDDQDGLDTGAVGTTADSGDRDESDRDDLAAGAVGSPDGPDGGDDPDQVAEADLPEPSPAEVLDVDVEDELDPDVARSIGELFDDPEDSPTGLPAPLLDSDTDRDDSVGPDEQPGHEARVATGIPGEALRASPPGTDALEQLRTSRVDGPTVEVSPQDDDTGYNVRRPQRLRDYDPAPIPIPAKVPRLLGRKPRVRKVTRVVRHVDPWSVFKIAIIANLVLYVIMLTAGVLLWNVANATGTVDNVERFFESFGWSSFEFNGGEIYHSAWIAGLFMVVGLTGAAVLLATLFNLITDLVGGMRFTVLEEEVVETRTSPMRRFVVRRPEPEVPAIDHDESGPIVREAVVDDSGAIVRRTR